MSNNQILFIQTEPEEIHLSKPSHVTHIHTKLCQQLLPPLRVTPHLGAQSYQCSLSQFPFQSPLLSPVTLILRVFSPPHSE